MPAPRGEELDGALNAAGDFARSRSIPEGFGKDWTATISNSVSEGGIAERTLLSLNKERSTFITGLRDACARDQQAASVIDWLAARIKKDVALRQRARRYAAETQRQVARLERWLLPAYATRAPAQKPGISAIVVQRIIEGLSEDVAADMLINYALTHLETASYRALADMAERLEYDNIADICVQCLEEKLGLAGWLDERVEATAH